MKSKITQEILKNSNVLDQETVKSIVDEKISEYDIIVDEKLRTKINLSLYPAAKDKVGAGRISTNDEVRTGITNEEIGPSFVSPEGLRLISDQLATKAELQQAKSDISVTFNGDDERISALQSRVDDLDSRVNENAQNISDIPNQIEDRLDVLDLSKYKATKEQYGSSRMAYTTEVMHGYTDPKIDDLTGDAVYDPAFVTPESLQAKIDALQETYVSYDAMNRRFDAIPSLAEAETMRQQLTASDQQIVRDYQAADASIRSDFATADNALATEFRAADANIISNYQADDAQIIADYKAADVALKDEMYRDMAGDGQDGEFLVVNYNNATSRNEVKSVPIINMSNVVINAEEVAAQKLEPVGMKEIFNTWYRFSHWRNEQNISGNTGHQMPGYNSDGTSNNWSGNEHAVARARWSYEVASNMIKSNRNSPVYSAFIHPQKLANWYLKIQAYGGGDGDNDAVCICCAFMKDSNGIEHTIDLVRARSGVGNGVWLDENGMEFYWSLVYDYRTTTQFELANNTNVWCAPTPIPDYGWNNNYCCISARRTMNNLKCYTSDVVANAITTVNDNSLIEFTLPSTKPAAWSNEMWANMNTMLGLPAQMGVGVHSQNGLFTILEQKYIFADQKIYDMTTDTIWEFKETTQVWNNVGKVTSLLKDGQLYYNQKTHRLMYYTNNQMVQINDFTA